MCSKLLVAVVVVVDDKRVACLRVRQREGSDRRTHAERPSDWTLPCGNVLAVTSCGCVLVAHCAAYTALQVQRSIQQRARFTRPLLIIVLHHRR